MALSKKKLSPNEERIKSEIKDMLLSELAGVYCWNCEHESKDEVECEYCHRKYMNWKISQTTATEIADRIVKEIIPEE